MTEGRAWAIVIGWAALALAGAFLWSAAVVL